jgi:hypothetical protein
VTTYLATLLDGRSVRIELPYDHAGAPVLLDEIAKQHECTKRDVKAIVRNPGKPDERTVYTLTSSRGAASPLSQKVRLFVSYVYEPAEREKDDPKREYGSALLDMEYEPYEQGHLDHVTRIIAEAIGSERVIVLGWQRVERN